MAMPRAANHAVAEVLGAGVCGRARRYAVTATARATAPNQLVSTTAIIPSAART